MKKISKKRLVTVIFFTLAISILSSYFLSKNTESNSTIEIISCLARNRVIPFKPIEIRSTIIIGFKILPENKKLSDLKIKGELYCNNQLISTDEILNLDSLGNNLGLEIPLSKGGFKDETLLSIPDGNYLIIISLYDDHLQPIAQAKKELNKNQIGRRFYGFDNPYKRKTYHEVAIDTYKVHQEKTSDIFGTQDYIVFQKNYLERIYPHTIPDHSKCISRIDIDIFRNEYKPLTFSIHSLKNLGLVEVEITPLKNCLGEALEKPKIGVVNLLTEIVEKKPDENFVSYRWAPKIIRPETVAISSNCSQRYWITLKTNTHTAPGIYNGTISIKPQNSHKIEIPIHVKVLPFTLTDTDIDYGMMMTYEFYELDNKQWNDIEKSAIRQNGIKIYNNLREHGMTMIYPHSYFYFTRGKNGQPVLDDLKASLEAYVKIGFPGPFCWYLGHLLQTAKPSHPGSIKNYSSRVAKKRLRILLQLYEKIAKKLNIPKKKLIVQLVDEPDRDDRIKAGKELDKLAQQMGFKTLATRKWPEADIICTSVPKNDAIAKKLRLTYKNFWIYPNFALTTKNRSYTRYVFGYGAWRWGVKGVVPWTFQMTQGCNGNPFTILDGTEVMVAYPGINGPITTPTWESIRDGINDYKYIYQLEKLICSEKAKGNPKAAIIEHQINQLKYNLSDYPGIKENIFGDWHPTSFKKRREQIIKWMFELSAQSRNYDN